MKNMYLSTQTVILIGLYLLLTLRSVHPRRDSIKILYKYFDNKTTTNPVDYGEKIAEYEAEQQNTSKTAEVLTAQLPINQTTRTQEEESINVTNMMDPDVVLNKAEQQNTSKTTDLLAAQMPINQATKTVEEESTNVTNMMDPDVVLNKTDILELTTVTNAKETNTETSNENVFADLIPLTAYSDGEVHIGQTIELQRSNMDSDAEITNEAGVEILKNVSKVCGKLLGKRISFANITTLMEFPWTVLLLYNTTEIYHCGGSLITTKYVLTAAHCVAQEFYELTGVRLGEHDVTKERDCELDVGGDEICSTTIDVKVVKITIHHGYSRLSFKNDIALLRLEQDYYSRSFYPICLPPPESTYTNTMALVAGWGATEKAIRSTVLRKAEVPILNMSNCRSIYRYSKFNDTTEICGSGVNEIDVCQGDSGGAIFYQDTTKNNPKHFQLGIISLGVRRCGDKRFLPAVFTKLTGYYKWIENNLES